MIGDKFKNILPLAQFEISYVHFILYLIIVHWCVCEYTY